LDVIYLDGDAPKGVSDARDTSKFC
jgi:hypothetical protein